MFGASECPMEGNSSYPAILSKAKDLLLRAPEQSPRNTTESTEHHGVDLLGGNSSHFFEPRDHWMLKHQTERSAFHLRFPPNSPVYAVSGAECCRNPGVRGIPFHSVDFRGQDQAALRPSMPYIQNSSNPLGSPAMLISTAMNAQMNEQIGHEYGASLQYVNIAAYFDDVGLPTLRDHFFKQADEERQHAMKFVRYILDAGGHLEIPMVPAPRHAFESAEQAVSLALEWEYTVTKQINALLERASAERDYVAHDFLEWFAREQLEEVSSMDTLLKMIRRTGESGLMLVEGALSRGQGLSLGGPPASES
jgi:ferritin